MGAGASTSVIPPDEEKVRPIERTDTALGKISVLLETTKVGVIFAIGIFGSIFVIAIVVRANHCATTMIVVVRSPHPGLGQAESAKLAPCSDEDEDESSEDEIEDEEDQKAAADAKGADIHTRTHIHTH